LYSINNVKKYAHNTIQEARRANPAVYDDAARYGTRKIVKGRCRGKTS
jgi:hypothetical protein